jgi:Dolichyl-phosphate-mannose-protein mannosyltransferase
MSRIQNIFRHYSLPILLISLLFFVKALYLAFCVTPFSAIPDEIGHYAYVQDIANGKGIPVLSSPTVGKSLIGADIMGYIENTPDALPAYNWIAQHPPIYYVIAAIPLKIGSWLTSDKNILYRLPRIVSALAGALLLLVLFRTFRVVGLDSARSTAIAAAIGFIPMISHLSSGTNHDIPLLFFCALATYFFIRYFIFHNTKDAYWCATWLAISGGIKMLTPWVLLVSMIFFLILELSRSNKIKHAIGIFLISISIPITWMIRNFIYFGSFLYTSGTNRKAGLDVPLNQNFFDFIHSKPAFDLFINTFYGMFGHIGAGPGKTFLQDDISPRSLEFNIFVVGGPLNTFFLILLFTLGCVAIFYILILTWRAIKENSILLDTHISISQENSIFKKHHFKILLIIIFFIISMGFSVFIGVTSFTVFRPIFFSIVPISIFLGIFACPLLFSISDDIDRIALYGFVITLFFGSLLLYHIYATYLVEGQLLATQGRYFYPVIPLLLSSLAITIMRLRIPAMMVNVVVALVACVELSVYIQQVIPFFLNYY